MPAAAMKPKNTNNTDAPIESENMKDIPLNDDTSNRDEYLDPKSISQGIIDKKIRNLVKRRDKLMDFKSKEERGVKLEKEQKDALAKLEYVVETIDILKDIRKNVTESLNDFQKKQNKAQKKEALAEKAKQKAEDSSRLHVMFQLPFIARSFDKIKPVLEQDGKLDKTHVDAFAQFSSIFDKYEKDSFSIIERFFAGESSDYIENVSFSALKDQLFGLFESNFFKTFLEPEIPVDYVSFEEQVSLHEPENTSTVQPPESYGLVHDVNIQNDMQSKDPAVIAVGHGFTFQGIPPQPVNGLAFMAPIPVHPFPPHPHSESFQMINQPVSLEPTPVPPSEENTSLQSTSLPMDESKSDGASTPEAQSGNENSNRRGNFRGRFRGYYRGNRNFRPKMNHFNPKSSNEDLPNSTEPQATNPPEPREHKKRNNKSRSNRNEHDNSGQSQHQQNDQEKERPVQEQKTVAPKEEQQKPQQSNRQNELKVKQQQDGDSNDNTNSKKNFNAEKRNNFSKRPFNRQNENGEARNFEQQDGQRPYYNNNNTNRGGFRPNGYRGANRGGYRGNNNNYGNRQYQNQPQQQQQQQQQQHA